MNTRSRVSSMSRTARTTLFLCAAAFSAFAEDWPQYRGPQNNGISTEKIAAPWAAKPNVLWTINVGQGMGALSIKDGKGFYLAATNSNTTESCLALDIKTGKQIWSTPLGRAFERTAGQGGPGGSAAGTPLIDGDKVYAYTSKFVLACLNAADGKILWQHNIVKEYHGQEDTPGIDAWANASCPLIEGDLLLIAGGGPGETFLAFDKTDGKLAWKKHTDLLTQSTPILATIHGVRQIIFFMQSGLVSLDPKTGDILWKQPHDFRTAAAASPVVGGPNGDIVYCSVGYSVGGGAYQITKTGDKFSSKTLWRLQGKSMNHWSTPVYKDGYLYGIFSASDPESGPLACVELATGAEKWKVPGIGQGEVLLIDGKLLVQCADGRLLLAEATPTGFKQTSQTQPLEGQAWGFPAYSNGILYYRTNVDPAKAAAVDLSK